MNTHKIYSLMAASVLCGGAAIGAEWKEISAVQFHVKPDTALDFSSSSRIPLENGRLPRLSVDETGRLCAGKGTPVRLMGFNLGAQYYKGSKTRPYPSPENIAAFGRAVRTRGYNAMRIFRFDVVGKEDFKHYPYFIDYFDRVMAEAGKNGIYVYLPICSYRNFLSIKRKDHHNDRKIRMYLGDPELRNAWKFGVDFLLNHVNPYTGRNYRDDTTIGVIEFYNELEGGLLWRNVSPETMEKFQQRFLTFLKERYPDKVKTAPRFSNPILTNNATPEQLEFISDLARENFDWCEKILRDAGYRGLIAQYDVPHWLDNCAVRYEKSPLALSHKYFAHPYKRNGEWYTRQDSCIENFALNFVIANASRFADRPHLITEYNTPCWNRYQYEAGLLFGGYAALQGTSGLFIHSDSVIARPQNGTKPYSYFDVVNNPVLLGGEFLANALYLRGDAKKAEHRVDLRINLKDRQKFQSVSLDQMKIALMTGFALDFPGLPVPKGVNPAKKADLFIGMEGSSVDAGFAGGWSAELKNEGSGKFSLDSFVNQLKKEKILSVRNLTQPSKGIFQSETGEILMNSPQKKIEIRTPRTEAVAAKAGIIENAAGVLKRVETSEDGCVGAVAVDGRNLSRSQRIVLVYTTEVRNHGEEQSEDKTILLKRGTLPVEMKCGKFSVELKNSNPGPFTLYSLGIDGLRREELPVKQLNGMIVVSVDTSKLKEITPFFELNYS